MSHSPGGDGVHRYEERLSIHDVEDLRNRLLEEAQGSSYLIHLVSPNCIMTWEVYWCIGLKKNIVEFVSKFANCQQVKAEHLKLGGLIQIMDVPTWKWEDINMDFIVGLLRTRGKKIQYGLLWIG